MRFIGAILFVLTFVLIAPQTQKHIGGVFSEQAAFMSRWAPYSYLLLLILFGALFAGMWVVQTWPQHVEPENPMAKYRREAPLEED
jgi:hypothetical protein